MISLTRSEKTTSTDRENTDAVQHEVPKEKAERQMNESKRGSTACMSPLLVYHAARVQKYVMAGWNPERASDRKCFVKSAE